MVQQLAHRLANRLLVVDQQHRDLALNARRQRIGAQQRLVERSLQAGGQDNPEHAAATQDRLHFEPMPEQCGQAANDRQTHAQALGPVALGLSI